MAREHMSAQETDQELSSFVPESGSAGALVALIATQVMLLLMVFS